MPGIATTDISDRAERTPCLPVGPFHPIKLSSGVGTDLPSSPDEGGEEMLAAGWVG